jgi:UDP-N-acetylmuramate--alanine ligase
MYQVNFDQPQKVFFIGIGGISMSGLAEILLDRGFEVYGSDRDITPISKGATIYQGHDENHIHNDLSFIVYTAAIKKDNPEYMQGVSLAIPLISRAELLGQVMAHYKYSVGVAGTHGKTTTTSMVAHIFENCGIDATISVGGILKLIDGNIKVGSSDYFVTEACEYANSFLEFKPFIGIVLNIDEDHMDFFKDLDDIRHSFLTYLGNIPKNGYAIINSAALKETDLYDNLECNTITFGLSEVDSDYYPKNVSYNAFGLGSYEFYHHDTHLCTVHLKTTGEHNVLNSLSAMTMAHLLGLDLDQAAIGLSTFSGANRRFEYKGDLGGVTIIDDYAHHPSEIEATINAAKKIVKNKLWIVFQPHTYTRTIRFLEDFARVLAKADGIILTDIYAAREKDEHTVHSKDLLKAINSLNPNVAYIPSFDDVQVFILSHCVPNDLLITMGAGNVFLIGEDILNS